MSGETKEAISNAAQSNSIGQHASGNDAGSKVGTTEAADGEKKVKSEKERMETSQDVESCVALQYLHMNSIIDPL